MLKINCKTRYHSEFNDYIQINCIMSREKVFNLIFFPIILQNAQ